MPVLGIVPPQNSIFCSANFNSTLFFGYVRFHTGPFCHHRKYRLVVDLIFVNSFPHILWTKQA